MKMIFIFIDGFGIGKPDASVNPLVNPELVNINYILNDAGAIPTDACLDVPGLPQSATGQTAIFTGQNASKVLSRHLHGQPTITLKKMIADGNLFKELVNRGFAVTNSNVYRTPYIDRIKDPKERKYRPSVTTVMTLSCGLNLRTVEEYIAGEGVYHDITGEILKNEGYVKELITPQEAAQRLYSLSRKYDFTLFEYFKTDIMGHKAEMDTAIENLKILDAFIGELLKLYDENGEIIFITSDHGNIEDLTVNTHTFNKVPTVILGKIPKNVEIKINSLTDIMPAILNIFDAKGEL
ncbi:alkaline phosphatase family protein [Acetivibrio straminisolvens]|uniref:Phosphoglyceromutase n=1 Tax=Acetivibrio straminisolvens JCM 21531 TaxID=1294263 RepID=W4VB97_9FIRM|nr:alkaline phosphatase family protein [Acetivibrio straminisolvens]GAE90078.1 phosphoglyceromutase [Acetivibrio straminisolvens JCM 21531]